MFGPLQVGVGFQESHRLPAGQINEGQIRQFRHLQVTKTRLLRSQKFARPAQFQILLGQYKAVLCLFHHRQPRIDCLGVFVVGAVVRSQQAIRLMRSAPHPAPELVQLRQAEPIRALDQHGAGIGHIHPHLDD